MDSNPPCQEFYLERRNGPQGALLVTPRQLEALIRLSEARARAELRDVVTKADVEDVLELLRHGFNFQAGLSNCTMLSVQRCLNKSPKHLRSRSQSMSKDVKGVSEMC